MSEAPVDPPNPRLAALAKAAAMLQWPIPRVRDEAVCVLLAKAIDSVLASVSRGRGALDIAIGEHLDVLGSGDRVLRLGYVSVGDYAREMLGIRASTAQKMARFARRLRDCPLLADPVPAVPVDDWMEPAKKWLEEQSARWAALMQVSPVAVWEPIPDVHADAHGLHEQLRRLASQRDDWDGLFGHLAMLLQRTQAWRLLGFASFGHYCDERLGMSERAVQQRASLERRLYDLPSLRQDMCERRVSYEKARTIAR